MAVPLQLLIVDEHAHVRRAFTERLRRVPEAVVLASVSDVASALPLLAALRPDVVLYEPKTSSHLQRDELEPLLAAGCPVVVWTSWLGCDEASAFLRAGARAVLLKDTNIRGLIRRLSSIAA